MLTNNIKIWLYFFFLFLGSCSTNTPLKQGYFNVKENKGDQKVDCILSDNIFYSTTYYTLLQCGTSKNDFFFIPTSLKIESDINGNPIVFSQFIKKDFVNIIVKYSYNKEAFIQASNYLKSIDASYNLHMLPINSISISNSTAIPDRNINYYGVGSYGFFDGYIVFSIKGKNQISSMRSLLFSSSGFQMIYEFSFLINRSETLIQKRVQIPIYINNINF
jgi:hypothetical protein